MAQGCHRRIRPVSQNDLWRWLHSRPSLANTLWTLRFLKWHPGGRVPRPRPRFMNDLVYDLETGMWDGLLTFDSIPAQTSF